MSLAFVSNFHISQSLLNNYIILYQSPNGMYLASGAENGSIHIFDVPTGKLLHSLPGTLTLSKTEII